MAGVDDELLREELSGRTLAELTAIRSPMPPVHIYDGQILAIQRSLHSSVPREVAVRVAVTRDLAVYGAFCYQFFAVSAYWSFTCIEMALWTKYREINPVSNRKITLGPLVDWAVKRELLHPGVLTPVALARLRNEMAHPREFSLALTPAMALDAFALMVNIVNHLWPLEP